MNKIPLVDLKAQYRIIKPEIDKAIASILAKTNFIMGEEVAWFEEAFAKFLGVKYVIGVSSGTDAIHLGLLALGVKSGDEVITAPHTFTATVEPICWLGAKPVFVDIDPKTFTINPKLIERAITKKTKVILPVHLYGHPADMEPIIKLAKKYKLKVLEDAAQAHGALYKGKMVGTLGDAAIFSFFPGKNLGAFGDAGVVVTNNEKLADKIILLRNHGRSEKYTHLEVGYGDRLDTLQAAILLAKIKRLKNWNRRRRQIAGIYNNVLKNLPIRLPEAASWAHTVYHLYVIRTQNRDELKQYLKEQDIETGIHYPIPLHLQPAYKYLGYKKGDFAKSEQAAQEILSLPLYPELNIQQIKFIANSLKKFYL